MQVSRKKSRAAAGVLVILAGAFVLLTRGGAQMLPSAQPPMPPAPAPSAPASAVPQVPTIVTTSNLVNMVFSVEDKHGAFIPNLTRADFRVLDNGHPQAIQFFSADQQLPLTLGLLLDTSPSQAGILGQEQQISDQFFRTVMTSKDLAFLIGFDVNVSLLQDLTSSPAQLSAAVDQAHIGGGAITGLGNPGPFPTQGGGATHLWDAIYLACHDELAHQVGRKAVIVVTDGGEQGSTYTNQDALRACLDSNTVVFAIIASDRSFGGYGAFGAGSGPGQLRHVAEQTGGRSINAGNKLGQAFTQIQQELRSQYSLGFHPPAETSDAGAGAYHTVKIQLTGAPAQAGDKVRARDGYYAPSAASQP